MFSLKRKCFSLSASVENPKHKKYLNRFLLLLRRRRWCCKEPLVTLPAPSAY